MIEATTTFSRVVWVNDIGRRAISLPKIVL